MLCERTLVVERVWLEADDELVRVNATVDSVVDKMVVEVNEELIRLEDFVEVPVSTGIIVRPSSSFGDALEDSCVVLLE